MTVTCEERRKMTCMMVVIVMKYFHGDDIFTTIRSTTVGDVSQEIRFPYHEKL